MSISTVIGRPDAKNMRELNRGKIVELKIIATLQKEEKESRERDKKIFQGGI